MFNDICGFTVYSLALYFIIFSFAGWLMETIRVSSREKSLVNRGFLNGPYCPIYGVGMLFIIIFLTKYKSNYILLGFMGMVLASALEYFTSYILEKLFHASWWDYSYRKLNINGRISLDISVAWGILSLIMIEYVVPLIDKVISLINVKIGIIIIDVFACIFVIDLGVTLYHLISLSSIMDRINQNRLELREATNIFKTSIKDNINLDTEELKAKFDEKFGDIISKYANIDKFKANKIKNSFKDFKVEIKLSLAELTEKLDDKLDEIMDKNSFADKLEVYKERYKLYNKMKANYVYRRILKAFPNFKSRDEFKNKVIKEIKEYLAEKNNEKNK